MRWDRKIHNAQLFTKQDGVPSNNLYCILPDEYGYLWISTDRGLVQFNKASKRIKVYTEKDGVADNEFNRISSFKARNGYLYFGGVNGVTSFHPQDFLADTTSLSVPLLVTDYYQYSEHTDGPLELTLPLVNQKKIVLCPGDKFFQIDFALLDYKAPAKQYKYTIEGVTKNWQHLSEPTLRVGGLPYGNYKLQIAGQSSAGTWSVNQLSIPIEVIRPFYLRWWAFIVYALGFVAFLRDVYMYQFRAAQVKVNQEKKEELNELQTKLYTNITHEFRTPLTVIMGMANQITEDVRNDTEDGQDLRITHFPNLISSLDVRSEAHLINRS